MTRRYSLFDATNTNANLGIETGGVELVNDITTGAPGVSSFGSIAVTEGSHFVEFLVYGDAGALASGKNDYCVIGVCTANHPNSEEVGKNLFSYGYAVGTGGIRNFDLAIANVTPGVIGDIIGMLVTFSDTECNVAWYLNGVFIYSVDVYQSSPTDLFGDAIYWVASVGAETTPGDVRLFVNSGRRRFEYPSAEADGWYSTTVLGDAIRISDDPFVSMPDDDFPNVRYEDMITAAGVEQYRSVHFWPWGDSQGARDSAVEITCTDPDGVLDVLLSGAYRDQPMLVQESDTTLDAATDILPCYFERMEILDDITRKLVGRGPLAQLDAPLQDRYFLPNATGGAANRAYPTTIGACFSVEPPVFDEIRFRYAIDSEGAEGIGKVRDKGDPLTNQGSPTDYEIQDGGQHIELFNTPAGIVTVDAGVTGSEYQAPVVSDDDIGNDGYFTGTPGGAIDGWNRTGLGLSPAPTFENPDYVEFEQDYMYRSYITHGTVQLIAGQRYRISFELVQIEDLSDVFIPARVGFTYQNDQFGYYYQVTSLDGPGVYTFTYTPASTHDIIIFYYGNNIVAGRDCQIRAVTVTNIPALDDSVDDDVIDEEIAALALPLESICRQIIEDRGRKPAALWDSTTAADIDTDTGYTGQGFHAVEQITIRDALEQVLTGYTAGIYVGRDGKIKLTRMVFPEDVATSEYAFSLSEDDFLSPLIPSRDEAAGLSRSMGVMRNERTLTDTDLVTDEIAVTMRLRRKLGRRHRNIMTSGAPFAAGYDHAEAAQPVDGRLVMPADGQAEIDRICAGYGRARAFYTTSMMLNTAVDIGAIGLLTYDRYGLSEGVPVMVVSIRENPITQRMSQVTFWGLAPEEL